MDEGNFLYDSLVNDAASVATSTSDHGGDPPPHITESTDDEPVVKSKPAASRFGEPVTEADILRKIEGAVPVTTRKTTDDKSTEPTSAQARTQGGACAPPFLRSPFIEQ